MPSHRIADRIRRHSLTGVAILLIPHSCAPAYNPPPVDSRIVGISRTTESMLERGHAVHQAKCAKCHPFENPAAYQPVDLANRIMPAMARKAKLDATDEQAVLAYLLAARQLPPEAAR